jgi:hypothetical protein
MEKEKDAPAKEKTAEKARKIQVNPIFRPV